MIPAIEEVVEHLSRLPGIGVKLATRLAYHLLKRDPAEAQVLARGIACLHERVYRCVCCGAFCEGRTCALCTDASRDRGIICVVERAQDVEMMAGVGEYRGLFHVLGGVIAPLEGVGPDQLRIAALLKRLQESSVREVILALNPTVEGDTTALYVQKNPCKLSGNSNASSVWYPRRGGLRIYRPNDIGAQPAWAPAT